jgi:hypothetical protein
VCLTNQQGYYGTAAGKGKQAAKGELEKLKLTEMTVRQAVKEVAKMFVLCLICSEQFLASTLFMMMSRTKNSSWN